MDLLDDSSNEYVSGVIKLHQVHTSSGSGTHCNVSRSYIKVPIKVLINTEQTIQPSHLSYQEILVFLGDHFNTLIHEHDTKSIDSGNAVGSFLYDQNLNNVTTTTSDPPFWKYNFLSGIYYSGSTTSTVITDLFPLKIHKTGKMNN